MAWIKYTTNLDESPEVIQMAETLGVDAFAITGRLLKLWSWATNHTPDGNARGVTKTFIDRYVDMPHFAQAMVSVGWLVVTDRGVTFPRWDVHMSDGAKSRAMTQKRVVLSRIRNAASVTKSLPDKIREDKRRQEELNPPTPQGGAEKLAEMSDLPNPIKTPRFWVVWKEWRKHRSEKRQSLKPTSERKQLAAMAQMGEDRAVIAIEWSIKNGYTGIFEPSGAGNGRTAHRDTKRASEYPEGESLLPVL
jgi:hypothetical protein